MLFKRSANKNNLGSRLKALFASSSSNENFFMEIEDVLIEGDIGPRIALEVTQEMKKEVGRSSFKRKEDGLDVVKRILSQFIKIETLKPVKDKLNIFLVLGVNGVGKTTTIAKLADYFRKNYSTERIIFSAGDTFRAAAIDQLKLLGKRLSIPVVSQSPGADPGAVIFDSISNAYARGVELILADTAGRMHNRADLIRELAKIDKIIRSKIGTGNYKKLLVIDATTGQNALQQTINFHEAIGVDFIFLAKYDSTAKGGIVAAICRQTGIPFSFMGTGERMEDIAAFDTDKYLDILLGLK